jgi:short-subunit dehydrogenase
MKSWAIVTGASSGIGAEFARQLSAQYDIVAVARRRDRLEALAAWAAERGCRVVPLVADLQTREGIAAVLQHAQRLESVSLLINCAGYADHGAFVDLPERHSRSLVELNVVAPLELTRGILPKMVARRSGQIVNVASGMAFQSVPYFSTYAASKAFVLSFTDGLARELAGTGVQVQALCPGVTRTEFGSVPGIEAVLSRLPTSEATDVVRASLAGLRRKKVVVTVGAFTRLMGLLAGVTPRWLNRWVGGRLMQPVRPALLAPTAAP